MWKKELVHHFWTLTNTGLEDDCQCHSWFLLITSNVCRPEALQKHRKGCRALSRRDSARQNNPVRDPEGSGRGSYKLPGKAPKAYCCYLCGRQYGSQRCATWERLLSASHFFARRFIPTAAGNKSFCKLSSYSACCFLQNITTSWCIVHLLGLYAHRKYNAENVSCEFAVGRCMIPK